MIYRTGQTITIIAGYPDSGDALFPRSVLLDETGTPLGASPVDLTSMGAGTNLYSGTFTMPANEKVISTTLFYTDAGHTTLAADQEQLVEEFVNASELTSAINTELLDDFAALPTASEVATAVESQLADDFAALPTASENAVAVESQLADDFALLETEADAASRAAADIAEHDATQAAIAALDLAGVSSEVLAGVLRARQGLAIKVLPEDKIIVKVNPEPKVKVLVKCD